MNYINSFISCLFCIRNGAKVSNYNPSENTKVSTSKTSKTNNINSENKKLYWVCLSGNEHPITQSYCKCLSDSLR